MAHPKSIRRSSASLELDLNTVEMRLDVCN